jgi:hypothetical protein
MKGRSDYFYSRENADSIEADSFMGTKKSAGYR